MHGLRWAASCSARAQSVRRLWELWAAQRRTRRPTEQWEPSTATDRRYPAADWSPVTDSQILQQRTAPAALWTVRRTVRLAASRYTCDVPATERPACASDWETARRWSPAGPVIRGTISSCRCWPSTRYHWRLCQTLASLEILRQHIHYTTAIFYTVSRKKTVEFTVHNFNKSKYIL